MAPLRQRRSPQQQQQPAKGVKERELESLDFEDSLSPVLEAHLRKQTKWDRLKTTLWRWILLSITGVVIATLAVLIISSTRFLQRVKFSVIYALIQKERDGLFDAGSAFLAFMAICVTYATLAALPAVFVEPSAGGSGIPEIIAVLNGMRLRMPLRLKTLWCRVVGIPFAVASGLPVGYEGPMVSIGAAVAAGVSQGKSSTLGVDTRLLVFRPFRRDAAKRDFITCGAGAGIAAAFNAPIGGVLFALEESATHWKKSLAWRVFACALLGAFTLDFLLSGLTQYIDWAAGASGDATGAAEAGSPSAAASWGVLSGDAMLSLGSFSATGQTAVTWGAWEIPLFIMIGALGGVSGAAFNVANKAITRVRLRRAAAVTAAAAAAAAEAPADQPSRPPTTAATGTGDSNHSDGSTLMLPAWSGRSTERTSSSGSASHAQQPLLGQEYEPVAEQPGLGPHDSEHFTKGTPGSWPRSASPTTPGRPTPALSAMRLCEVVAVSAVVSAVSFLGPVLLGSCTPLPPEDTAAANRYSGAFVTLYCPVGSFNPLASLWLAPQEESIRFLLHFTAGNGTGPGSGGNHSAESGPAAAFATERPGQKAGHITTSAPGGHVASTLGSRTGATAAAASVTAPSFSPLQLSFFFLAYTLLMCVTAGIALPSGLFIPTLLAGAALGRLVGEGINRYAVTDQWAVDPGTYALLGAAALTSGVTRLSVSLAAILLESSGNVSLSLPIALTIMTARAVGGLFSEGIYDVQIDLRGWPVLQGLPTCGGQGALAYELRACDVMRHLPLVFSEIESVGRLHDVLVATGHHGFPVVFSEQMASSHPRLGSLAGFVQRRHLAVILAARAFHADPPRAVSELTPLAAVAAAAADSASVRSSSGQRSRGSSAGGHRSHRSHGEQGGSSSGAEGSGAASGLLDIERGVAQVRYGAHTGSNAGRGAAGGAAGASSGSMRRSGSHARLSDRVVAVHDDGDDDDDDDDDTFVSHDDEEADRDTTGLRKTGPMRRSRMDLVGPVGSAASSGSGSAGLGSARLRGEVRLCKPSVSNLYLHQSLTSGALGAEAEAAAATREGSQGPALAVYVARGSAGGDRARAHARAASLPAAPSSAAAALPRRIYTPPAAASQQQPARRASSSTPPLPVAPPTGPAEGPAALAARTGRGIGTFTTVRTSSSGSVSKAVATVRGEVLPGGISSAASSLLSTKAMKEALFAKPAASAGKSAVQFQSQPLLQESDVHHRGSSHPSHPESDHTAPALAMLSGVQTTSDHRYLPLGADDAGPATKHPSDGDDARSLAAAATASDASPAVAAASTTAGELYRALYAQEVLYDEEPLLSYQDLEGGYPRYPDPATIALTEGERAMFIDLRPYSDPSPITVHVHAPLVRTFRLFKTLGLRHLVVVNDSHDVVGVITRHDLSSDALAAKARQLGLAVQ